MTLSSHRDRSDTLSAPRLSTVKRLFAVSMNRCAFPGCSTPVIDPETQTVLGEICHIHAQSEGGPRFNDDLTTEQIHGFENLILMCGTHHKLIDEPGNEATYSAAYLMGLKVAVGHSGSKTETELSNEQATVLIQQSVVYEENAVHMDFRQAVFRVGGEGGQWGGGGGAGGTLTIVGSHRLPPSAIVNANGRDGAAPGGGGGGGGAIVFVGRAVDVQEIRTGFEISSIFAADATSGEGLFNALGAGWGYCRVGSLPANATVRFVVVVETAGIEEDALIRLTLDVMTPSGEIAGIQVIDIPGSPSQDLTPRHVARCVVSFAVAELGVWEFHVRSGDIRLKTHRIEFR
ncbi:HNH endonuclease [Comamonas humi]